MTENIGNEDNKVWNSLMQLQGREFQFEIGRDASAVARDGNRRGFSEEAMSTAIHHMITFIGTRVSQFELAHKVMPQQMVVRIRVDLDSEPRDFDESLESRELETVRIEHMEHDAAP